MTNDVTLYLELRNGRKLNLQVASTDWDGQKSLAENCLLTMHKRLGGREDEMPLDDILVADFIIRHMYSTIMKYDRKIDQLLAENAELEEMLRDAGAAEEDAEHPGA